MKKKLLMVAVAAGGAVGVLVPLAGAHAATKSATSSACIVIPLPNGANIQIGLAPGGPAGCVQL